MIPSAKTVIPEVFDISKLEPKSLYVVFTKRNHEGSERKMGLLLTMPEGHAFWANLLLCGDVSSSKDSRMPIRLISFANNVFPDYFPLHTAVKLNKEPLSDGSLETILGHMKWKNPEPTDLDGPLQEFLAVFLARVNFILPSKLKRTDKGQLVKNVFRLTETPRSPSIAPVSRML